MTTSIVILNWNGRDFLKKYLSCLLNSTEGYDDVQVVVADNASQDGSLTLLHEEFPEIKTIALDRNYGFAGGYNKALKQLDSDLFLLLNSDVEVTRGWLDPLIEWMELHPDCGMCAPLLHQTEKRDCFEYAGAAGGYLDRFCYPFCRGRVMKRLEKDEGQYDMPEEVLWVTGAALMTRRELFFGLGGFAGDFFAHMEEIDLCWRARLEGWKVNIIPRSTVYHVGGGSLPQDSPFKLQLNYRNNLLMMSRCLPKTMAVYSAYALLGKAVLPDEGPDMIHNCNSIFCREYDDQMQDDILTGSVDMGIMKADIVINLRMLLDRLSALVYLFTGKKECYRAVRKAHREFRALRGQADKQEMHGYLKAILYGERDDIARCILTDENAGSNLGSASIALKGMWNKWIVSESFFKKEAIFAEIKDSIR